MQVKLVKLKGEFQWHHHDVEDELFLVVSGTLLMKFRDRDVTVEQGEFIIVPHTVEHCPVALGEEWSRHAVRTVDNPQHRHRRLRTHAPRSAAALDRH